MHPSEPSIEELNKMFNELITNKSSDPNDIKKLTVLEKQIKRLMAEGVPTRKVEKPVEKVEEKPAEETVEKPVKKPAKKQIKK